jgi:hypothetical protein
MFGLLWGFAFANSFADRLQFAGIHSQVALLFYTLGLDISAWIASTMLFAALALLMRGARRVESASSFCRSLRRISPGIG